MRFLLPAVLSLMPFTSLAMTLDEFMAKVGVQNNYLQSQKLEAEAADLRQRDGDILISAIREYLSFTSNIYIDKTNCSKLKVTGVRSIENTLKLLQNAPVKLLGNKKLQYLL